MSAIKILFLKTVIDRSKYGVSLLIKFGVFYQGKTMKAGFLYCFFDCTMQHAKFTQPGIKPAPTVGFCNLNISQSLLSIYILSFLNELVKFLFVPFAVWVILIPHSKSLRHP